MKRKVGKVYDKKGQDIFVDFTGLSLEEIPDVSAALIIENVSFSMFRRLSIPLKSAHFP
jgi:hypothetical protein